MNTILWIFGIIILIGVIFLICCVISASRVDDIIDKQYNITDEGDDW
jgi:hypothetical protein